MVDLVDRGATRTLLANDREVQKSTATNDRLLRRLGVTSQRTGSAQTAASRAVAQAAGQVTAAVRTQSTQARVSASAVQTYARAQEQALRAGSLLERTTVAETAALRAQARAASASAKATDAAAAAQNRQAAATARQSKLSAAASGAAALYARGSGAIASASNAATGAAAGAGAVAAKVARGSAMTVGAGVIGAGFAVKEAVSFEKAMANVQSRLFASQKDFERLNQLALKLGADTSFSAQEAAGAMDELASAGFSADQMFKVLPGTLALAAASGADLASSAALQGAALRGFGLDASQAGRVADVLAQTVNVSALSMSDLATTLPYVASVAKQTGTSFEETAAMAGILGNAGLEASTIGTSLRTSMLRLTDPTMKMAGHLKDMGINADELAAVPLPDVIGRIAGGLKKLPTRGAQVGAVSAIFGKEAAPAVLNLLSQGEDKINRLTRSMENSEGAAKRSADVMRNTVAGSWDNFTGAVESGAIKLTRRFLPALKTTLDKASGFVNDFVNDVDRIPAAFAAGQKGGGQGRTGLAGVAADVSRRLPNVGSAVEGFQAGLAGRARQQTQPAFTANPMAGPVDRLRQARPGASIEGFSGVGKAAAAVGDVVRKAVDVAKVAAGQMLDALRPAAPFLQNVLLPLLQGVGKGLLSSIVVGFKVAVAIIKVFSTALGFVGRLLAPLKGAFQVVGQIVGMVFAGPILKGIGLLSKLGGVFKLVGVAANIAAVPIRIIAGVAGVLFRALSKLVTFIATKYLAIWVAAGLAVARLTAPLRNAAGRVFGFAKNIVSSVGRGLAGLAGRIAAPFKTGFEKAFEFMKGLGGRFFRIGKNLAGRLVDGVKIIGAAIKTVFSDGLGFVGDVGRAIKKWLNDKTLLGNEVKVGPVKMRLPKLRGGGRVPGYQDGGMVPILASGGEMLIDRGRAMMIGGRDDRDGTPLMARPGAAVLTYSGQAMMAAGATLGQALAGQMPHFAKGGVVPGRYTATSYGPPWGGINGTGVTRTGVNLRNSPKIYGVAVDPRMIPLGSRVYASPNPFGYRGAFRAFDTGGAIKGHRLDFYDWRGRAEQKQWGRRQVRVSRAPIGGAKSGMTERGADRTMNVPIRLGRSRTRAGLVSDAFSQGVQAGEAGLTRAEVARAVRGGRGARRNPIMDAIAQAQSATSRKVTITGAGDEKSKGSKPLSGRWIGGGWDGTENVVRRAIRGLGQASFKRSTAINGNRNSDHNTWIKNAFAADIPATGKRGDSIFRSIARRVGIAARKGSWNTFRNKPVRGVRSQLLWHAPDGSHRDHVHFGVRRMRRGGLVGRYASGGTVASRVGGGLGRRLSSALTFKGGTADALNLAIMGAAEARIEALRREVAAAVQRGGDAKIVQRLRGVIDMVDMELGRRVGRIRDVVAQRSSNLEGFRADFDRDRRRRNVDPASSKALTEQAWWEQIVGTPILKQNVKSAESAVRRAERSGNTEAIEQAFADLDAAQSALAEQMVSQVERWRDIIRAQAQERVDAAQFGVDQAQNVMSAVDIGQRLNRTTDTSGGMMQRAGAIQSLLLPALQQTFNAEQDRYFKLGAIGDHAGAAQAYLAAQRAAIDMGTAMADAADLVRDAAMRVYQDAVEEAQHQSTMADIGLRRLELEQRMIGTYDSAAGAEGRAEYIRSSIVPALKIEVAKLEDQRKDAVEKGDDKLAKSIAEQLGNKQNDILQAQLDATEQVAKNTEPLAEMAGTLGYEYQGERFTDGSIFRGGA